MSNPISIKGLDKATVFQALFNASKQQGMGTLDPRGRDSMTIETAREVVDTKAPLAFDYFLGRVLKVDITGDEFDPWLFDRDNGKGAAAAAIERLRV